jgi:hypothetical protein
MELEMKKGQRLQLECFFIYGGGWFLEACLHPVLISSPYGHAVARVFKWLTYRAKYLRTLMIKDGAEPLSPKTIPVEGLRYTQVAMTSVE